MPTPSPGTTIGRANWQAAETSLPAPVLEWIREGALEITVGETPGDVAWESAFRQASSGNDGRYGIDPAGNLVLRGGGAPGHFHGLPFPTIAGTDAGAKIVWNRWFTLAKAGQVHGHLDLVWLQRHELLGRRILEKELTMEIEQWQHYGNGRPAGYGADAEIESRHMFVFRSPHTVRGFRVLRLRDGLWECGVGQHAQRKPLSGAQLSKGVLESDFSLDDLFLWSGSCESFRWELVGRQDLLVPLHASEPVRLERGGSDATPSWSAPSSFAPMKVSCEVAPWTWAPWAPDPGCRWVVRPVYLVRGIPGDRSYRASRTDLYFDRETFCLHARVVYDRDDPARVAKTLLCDLVRWRSDEAGSVRFFHPSYCVAVRNEPGTPPVRQHGAVLRSGASTRFLADGIDPRTFTPAELELRGP